jgi:hypothetical protein
LHLDGDIGFAKVIRIRIIVKLILSESLKKAPAHAKDSLRMSEREVSVFIAGD